MDPIASPARLDVTVIMPSYNRSALITRALESLRKQTCWPRQLIVVDDASNDDTVERVETWAVQTGFPVRVERLSTNSGAAVARNRGMELATTRYLAFLDTDDEHLPQSLEKLVRALDTHSDAVVAFGDATKMSANQHTPNAMFIRRVNINTVGTRSSTDEEVFYLDEPKSILLKSSLIPTCSTCFRREDAIAAGGMPVQYRTGEDWMFWLRMSERGKFVFYMEDLAIVHRHPDNLTSPQSAEMTSRQKLIGYAALLDGSAGISISSPQRDFLRLQVDLYASEWRYQLSRLGVRRYRENMRHAKTLTGKSFFGNLLADPKSMARAIAASMTTLPPSIPE